MADINSPLVRLVAPTELPVRIPDWPESVGIALCRAGGRIISMQPYHLQENAMGLKRRLVKEAGDAMRGFAIWPAMKGMQEQNPGTAEDLRMMAELEQALRSRPRMVEEIFDFAINFEFAAEGGMGLDGLQDQSRRRTPPQAAKPTDQLPVGYQAFSQADPDCELISGAVLKPAGAAGIDLLLVPEKSLPVRHIPEETQVLVREDSLRVAIPLGPVMKGDKLPQALRLPAGALMLGQTGGKPVPAMVLRRKGFLFVAPDYAAVANPVTAPPVAAKASNIPWKAIGLTLAGVALVLGLAAAAWLLIQRSEAPPAPLAPVEGLRENLFAPRN